MSGLFDKNVGLAINQTPDAGTGNPITHTMQLATSVDILDQNGNGLGYIKQIGERHNRPSSIVYHVSAKDAGVGLEQVPQIQKGVVLDVQGFAIKNKQNDGSLIKRLATGTLTALKMLQEQKIPFIILYVEREPLTLQPLDATIWMECWLNSFSSTLMIEGDNKIAQTASILATKARRPINWTAL